MIKGIDVLSLSNSALSEVFAEELYFAELEAKINEFKRIIENLPDLDDLVTKSDIIDEIESAIGNLEFEVSVR